MPSSALLKISPYGKVNFAYIREHGLAYADKTRFIETLENCGADYPFIVRPRRFGKTLATNMLEAYYDEAAAERFERTFTGTYIGEHKTALASQFRVLHFDFSGIASSNHQTLTEEFQESVLSSIRNYFDRYPHPQQNEVLSGHFSSATVLITRFFSLLDTAAAPRLYVLIDEYDQFANEVLSRDLDHFKAITSSEGFLKNFFTKLKTYTNRLIARIFITGVTSISLDSMTSGFSISTNVTTFPAFADTYGFTEAELRSLIPQLLDIARWKVDPDVLTARMKEWYNGYRFSPQSEVTVFNPTMCLGYLLTWQNIGEEPDSLLDPNLGQNLDKIEKILQLGDAAFVKATVEQALRREPIPFTGRLKTLNLNQASQFDDSSLLSAMFYLGFLTYAPGKAQTLVIPNRAVSIQFFEYFLKHVLQTEKYEFVAADFLDAIQALVAGDPRPLFQVTCDRFTASGGLHTYTHLKESDFQTLLIGAFNFTNAYAVASEDEVRGKEKGYIDILAVPSPGSRADTSYLVEVKYLSPKRATESAKAEALAGAKEQIRRYEQGDNIKHLTKLKRIVALFVGLKLEKLDIF